VQSKLKNEDATIAFLPAAEARALLRHRDVIGVHSRASLWPVELSIKMRLRLPAFFLRRSAAHFSMHAAVVASASVAGDVRWRNAIKQRGVAWQLSTDCEREASWLLVGRLVSLLA